MQTILQHSVIQRKGEFLVVYPTPGLDFVPTLALICRTEQQANQEADRLNGYPQ